MIPNSKIIFPGSYSGQLKAPASKSYLQRALLIASLCSGISRVRGYSPNGDTDALIKGLISAGAEIRIHNEEINVKGIREFNGELTLHCGESGLAARMLAALSLLMDGTLTLTGEGSLLNRSMVMAADCLMQAGKKVCHSNGRLPLIITGPRCTGTFYTDSSQTSQFLTGLLIALSFADMPSVVVARETQSVPYVDITTGILTLCGFDLLQKDYTEFHVGGRTRPEQILYSSEGCWSNTAFHLVAAAVSGSVQVNNINTRSVQGDMSVRDVLVSAGSAVSTTTDSIAVRKNMLLPFTFDATQCPDLFPPLAALAANCDGKSVIRGVHRLRGKESDRASCLQSEFRKLGIHIIIQDDDMIIIGDTIRGGIVSSCNDHRIAMALSVLALNATDPVIIRDCDAVCKSYPHFYKDFERMKGKVQV